MEWLANFLSSPGTWRGATYLAMSAGVTLEPAQQNAIIAAGLAVAGLIHAFVSAKRSKPE